MEDGGTMQSIVGHSFAAVIVAVEGVMGKPKQRVQVKIES